MEGLPGNRESYSDWGNSHVPRIARGDRVFAGRADTYEAFNLTNGEMLCGVEGDGVATIGPAYLATYTYRVALTAAGDFVMDIRRDEAAGDQTFLIASGNGRIEVSATTPGNRLCDTGSNSKPCVLPHAWLPKMGGAPTRESGVFDDR